MVAANELRIGNWVYAPKIVVLGECKTSEASDMLPYQITDIYSDHHNKLYEPIPLTSEMLISCGFKYGMVEGITRFKDDIDEPDDEGDTYYWDFDIKETKFVDSHSLSIVKWGEQEYFTFQLERGFYRQKIKYLHQLQNLIFALSGKELEYKSKKDDGLPPGIRWE